MLMRVNEWLYVSTDVEDNIQSVRINRRRYVFYAVIKFKNITTEEWIFDEDKEGTQEDILAFVKRYNRKEF